MAPKRKPKSKRIQLPFVYRPDRREHKADAGVDIASGSGAVPEAPPVSKRSSHPSPKGSAESKPGSRSLAPPKHKFDRNAYQRDYMRDRKLAKAAGLTVAEYRAREAAR